MNNTWVGHTRVRPARVYALAFTPRGKMVLVRSNPDGPGWWLPGGGVEPGESPDEALGSLRVDSQQGMRAYHRYYWCRVRLEPVRTEDQREGGAHLVAPKDFLGNLQWGRSDPAASLLLDLAFGVDGRYR